MEQGRVHLTGLRLLAPHLTPGNADELLSAAARKSKEDIEQLLAARAPRLDVPVMVTPIVVEGAPEHLGNTDPQGVTAASVAPTRSSDRITPLSAESFAVQFTRSREADERFRYAQPLLGSRVKSGDLAEVYARAIEALIGKLEKIRFGACANPRKSLGQTQSGSRHVSPEVKRTVWIRDQGQCTYKSASGRRCEAREDLQFDHVKEFARGGETTVDNTRLRCPGHNKHTAEPTYGAGFMKQKRKEAAAARAAGRAAQERATAERAKAAEATRLQPHQLEIIPWLRELGCRDADCRIAVERCRDMAGAPLEERMRSALRWFGARISRTVSYAPAT